MRLRVCLHALDRTGPPNLAAAFLRWLRSTQPDVEADVVAFRGGPLAHELPAGIEVTVLLHDHEPWDHRDPDVTRVRELCGVLSALPLAEVTLLVSVAAGQVLQLLEPTGAVVTWAVEQGDDLHWVDEGIGLVEHTTSWIAGTDDVAAELESRVDAPITVVPEFVSAPAPIDPTNAAQWRARLGATSTQVLVLGAGIATTRKGPDLFLELALAVQRRATVDARFVWLGGESDELWPLLSEQIDRMGLESLVALHTATADFESMLGAGDVLAHPARLDAFPLVCLHAAALGLPVIGFAGCSALEAMFGDTAVVAPYPDIEKLADLVESLADETRRAQAGAAQQRAVARFTAPVAAPPLWAHLCHHASDRGA